MDSQHSPVRRLVVVACVIGFGVVGGCGLLGQNRGGVTSRPAELVVWGDRDPNNGGEGTTIRDVNNAEDRFVVVGTDGRVQFSDSSVCNDCAVEGATISIDGTPAVDIRFGTGPAGGDVRRPFLVSTDGFYIQLVREGDVMSFQEVELSFEEEDDPSDDLAERVGTTPNPAATRSRRSPLCGLAMATFAPLTALGIACMRLARRRRA